MTTSTQTTSSLIRFVEGKGFHNDADTALRTLIRQKVRTTDGRVGTVDGIYRTDYSDIGDCVVVVRYGNGSTEQQYLAHLTLHKEEPTKKLDMNKVLDAVVLPKEVKAEIISVLKQSQNSAKLFDEWGLGETIEYGKGMSFLFYGSPGTGKTFAAKCIAKAMGKELLTIGMAEIQTSEPGGANRNIISAFKSAKEKDNILFLDECDSLTYSREGLGMVLGGEVNTLLTEIEKFEGIIILATNSIAKLDKALERRISLIVEYPHPNQEQRASIYKKLIPKKLPLAKCVKIKALAKYSLTGGQIKNVILHSARLAMGEDAKEVTREHFERSIKRIIASTGKMGSHRNVARGGVTKGPAN